MSSIAHHHQKLQTLAHVAKKNKIAMRIIHPIAIENGSNTSRKFSCSTSSQIQHPIFMSKLFQLYKDLQN
jgi:hypothetical protein